MLGVEGLKTAIVYIDDLLTVSVSSEEHFGRLFQSFWCDSKVKEMSVS